MHKIPTLPTLFAAGCFLAPAMVQATLFSFGDDWSGTTNPHDGYTYGTAANTTDPVTAVPMATTPLAGVEAWSVEGGVPWVTRNTTGSTIVGGTPSYLAAPTHFLGTHPGPGGQYAVISYALPQTGSLVFTADFANADSVGASTDVHVFLAGTELFSGTVINNTVSYTTPGGGLPVTAGDLLQVRVGFGGGNYHFDSTAVRVEGAITAVPEPAAMAAWTAAALLTGGLWIRRRSR